MGLKTLTPDHRDLQLISIRVSINHSLNDGQRAEEIRSRWMDLDCFLVQLRKSNEFRLWVIYSTEREKEWARECLERLLPETTKRGIVELKS